MADLILLATMLLICGGIGLPLAELLPASWFRWRTLLAPALGYALLAVAAPVTYRWGATVPWILGIACAVAMVMLAWRSRRILWAVFVLPSAERQHAQFAVACVVAATLVMIAPRWVGGDQFAVFQGNQWDTHGYLESAVVYARRPYSSVSTADDNQIVRNPLVFLAKVSLTNRPSAHLLYSVFSRIWPGQTYRLYYAYLVGCFTLTILATLFIARNVLPTARPIGWAMAAVVFALGFWGQYVFDINSWSQTASTPILLVMTGLLISVAVLSDSPEVPLRQRFGLAAAIATVVAGAVYLYPEGFIIYAAAIFPIAVVIPIVRMFRERRLGLSPVVPLAGIPAGLALTIFYPPLLSHIVAQVTMVSTQKVSWWTFFQVFFLGRDGKNDGAFANSADFAAGLFGLYFATPAVGASALTAAIQRLAIVVTIVALLVALALLTLGMAKLRGSGDLTRESRHVLAAWLGASAMLLLPAGYLGLDGNYWPAGKAVSYAAPVFTMLLAVPAAYSFAHRALRPLRWIAVGFVLFQVGTGLTRISAAADPTGIHYAPPYPAVQARELKTDIGWNLTGLEQRLTREMHVVIQPMDVWMEHRLMVFLWSRGIPFAKRSDVVTAWGAGSNLGSYVPPWRPDVEISLAGGHVLVLHFPDGRPDVRVACSTGAG